MINSRSIGPIIMLRKSKKLKFQSPNFIELEFFLSMGINTDISYNPDSKMILLGTPVVYLPNISTTAADDNAYSFDSWSLHLNSRSQVIVFGM